jgi:hypothetical protein
MPGHSKENQLLSQDFIDILSAFYEEKVDYLLVGSYAMAFHGWARATGDIDLWIRPSEENSERVWRALQRFGAPLFDLELQDLRTPGTVFQMGMPPNRIDIITEIDGVTVDEAWSNQDVIEIYGLKLPLIGKSELLANKKAAGRPKDQIDVLWMESRDQSQ